jgi:hypothetical protein
MIAGLAGTEGFVKHGFNSGNLMAIALVVPPAMSGAAPCPA